MKLFDERRYLGFPAHFTSMYSPTSHPKSTAHARMPTTIGRRGESGFSQACLCPKSDVTLVSIDNKSSAQSDDELKHKAFKRIIDICEDSISRNDVHMTIQCDKCAKCRTCKNIKKINASSYNDFVEQQAMEQLVEFVEGRNGEPGYFISPLPLKPFNVNSVKGNRVTADE